MGSRDRKTLSEMVYGYFRLGNNSFGSIQEKVLAGISLGKNLPEIEEYFKIPAPEIVYEKIFPLTSYLSEGIDTEAFSRSFLIQPDLFLRLRRGKERSVLQKLANAGINYRRENEHCIVLPNTTKVDGILDINREVVIQDKSSQRTGAFISGNNISVWDCCAASGGKSIMAHDIIKNIRLTVSDIRPSIINNLKERFSQAGISNYTAFSADLTDDNDQLENNKYDLVIADVPCSGSGTWARTPEQLVFFKEEKIDDYFQLQQKIVSRVIPTIKPGGSLLYITCSVFAKENEEIVKIISEKFNLKINKQELIKGYNEKADTMFAALFKSSPA